MGAQCRPVRLGSSTDMDLWLLLAASEYGLATRDLGTFSAPVRWLHGGRASLWAHLRAAYRHQDRCAGRTAATTRARPATGRTSRPSSWA